MNDNMYYFPGHGLKYAWQRALARLGFHFIAVVTAICLSEVAASQLFLGNGASLSDALLEAYTTKVFIFNYCALLLIFPARLSMDDTIIGLLTGGIWLFFGAGFLALGFAAIVIYLSRLCREGQFVIWWSAVPLGGVLTSFVGIYSFSAISIWYWIIFAFMTIVGMSVASTDEEAANTVQKKQKPVVKQKNTGSKKRPAATNKAAKAQTAEQLETFEPVRSEQKILEDHKKLIVKLLRQAHFLPEALAIRIVTISERARLIIEAMENDPRDFEPGDKFLSRYLTATYDIMENVLKLSGQAVSNDSFAEVLAKSESLLARLETAFAEQHLRLLENDTIDLVSELNVLDKLLKMEGFK